MSIKSELHYPGTMSRVDPHGHYPGVAFKTFWTLWGYKRFFHEDKLDSPSAYVVVKEWLFPRLWGILGTTVVVAYTKQVSPEELTDMEEVTREIEYAMAERREKRRLAREEDEKLKVMANEEVKRLAAVGSKYEERVKHRKSLAPSDAEYKAIEALLNQGDPDVLFVTKMEAFQAGYLHGHKNGVLDGRKDPQAKLDAVTK